VAVVDRWDTIGRTEAEVSRALLVLRHAGVRLVIADLGWDTGDLSSFAGPAPAGWQAADDASFGMLAAQIGAAVALPVAGVAA
jgi:hypothetical protein